MRGKFEDQGTRQVPAPGFNEARAFCAGNSLKILLEHLGTQASMRPARFAREIAAAAPLADGAPAASMRPARFAREIVRASVVSGLPSRASMRPARFAREIDGRKRR